MTTKNRYDPVLGLQLPLQYKYSFLGHAYCISPSGWVCILNSPTASREFIILPSLLILPCLVIFILHGRKKHLIREDALRWGEQVLSSISKTPQIKAIDKLLVKEVYESRSGFPALQKDYNNGNSTGWEHIQVTRHLTKIMRIWKNLSLLPGFIHYWKVEIHHNNCLFSDNKHANSKDTNLAIMLSIMPLAMQGHDKMPHPTEIYKARQ